MAEELSHRQKLFLEALRKNFGIISKAIESCDGAIKSRNTHYDWLKESEAYREGVKDAREVALDLVEAKAFELINGIQIVRSGKKVYTTPPNERLIIHFLKTLGRSRGYGEVSEVVQYNPEGPPSWFNGEEIQ